jgi:hypothetical protein
MRSLKSLWMIAAMMSCLMSAGCGVRIGPQVEERYVIVHPGKPLTVLENTRVKGRAMDQTGGAVEQDIGGWKAMPPDHWEAIERRLEKQ